MIRSRLAQLQLQLRAIENAIGPLQQYKDKEVLQAREKIQQLISKSHKAVQRNFEKVKKGLANYGLSLDILPAQDKINIVSERLQDLKEVGTQLGDIEKLLKLKVLNNDELYIKIKGKYQNMSLLLTTSELQEKADPNIKVKSYDSKPLSKIRQQHRKQMNDLFQLNKRIILNLNNNLRLLKSKGQ